MEKKVATSILDGKKLYVKNVEEGKNLLDRGYGEKSGHRVELAPYEALHLMAGGWLEVSSKKPDAKIKFEELLRSYMKIDKKI